MHSNRGRNLMVALALVLTGAVVLPGWFRFFGSRGDAAGWNRGRLTVSERAYHEAQVKRIVNAWQEMACQAPRDEQWRIEQPYRTYLVMDLRQRALWIEEQGRVIEHCICEFPGWLTWEAQFVDQDGPRKLGDLVRLQCRGIHPDHRRPEFLFLVGYSEDHKYLAFCFNSVSLPQPSYGKGAFSCPWKAPPLKDGVDYYDSMIVNDAEYEQRRRAEAFAKQDPAFQLRLANVRTNMAPWSDVEEKLYQAIETKVIRTGFDLSRLVVESGPDCSAGHAEVQAGNDGWLRRLLRRRLSCGEAYLRIDHLGDGIWYARSVPNPHSILLPGMPTRKQLRLELVVSSHRSLSAAERREWIAKGREYQKDILRPPAGWKAELANGAAIELVGICKESSEGKQWWGPDGTALERAPYVSLRQFTEPRRELNVYEIVWRTRLPTGTHMTTMRAELEGSSPSRRMKKVWEGPAPSRHVPIHDYRYGDSELGDIGGDLTAIHCLPQESQDRTTLTLDMVFDNEDASVVKFKNISLVPGRDPGFEIEVVK